MDLRLCFFPFSKKVKKSFLGLGHRLIRLEIHQQIVYYLLASLPKLLSAQKMSFAALNAVWSHMHTDKEGQLH